MPMLQRAFPPVQPGSVTPAPRADSRPQPLRLRPPWPAGSPSGRRGLPGGDRQGRLTPRGRRACRRVIGSPAPGPRRRWAARRRPGSTPVFPTVVPRWPVI